MLMSVSGPKFAGQPDFLPVTRRSGRAAAWPMPAPDRVTFGDRPSVAPPSRTFQVQRNGVTVRLRQWWPSGSEPPAANRRAPSILLVHGLGGRSAWMAPLAEEMMKRAFGSQAVVYGIDIPEIGQNEDSVARFRNMEPMVSQVREAVNELAQRHGNNVHVMALSLGALLSCRMASDKPAGLKSLTLLSPAFKPHPDKIGFKIYASALKGLVTEKLMHRQGAGDVPLREEPDVPALPSGPGFSRLQREVVKEKLAATDKVDKLNLGRYLQMFRLMFEVRSHCVSKIDVPVRVYATQNDDLVDVTAIQDAFNKFPHANKQLTVFPRAWHDLVHDPVLRRIADELDGFLQNQAVAG